METRRVTMAQALLGFLKNQYVERDGQRTQILRRSAGNFRPREHGRYRPGAATKIPIFRTYWCATNSPVCTWRRRTPRRTTDCAPSPVPRRSDRAPPNMITGAALATINRLPVLLLPGDIFARRNVAPVLQQLESPATQDTGVNDCFKPVSRYWDRIYRPEQLITALPEVMRVLDLSSDCGAVTLALPQDVQAEAYDYRRNSSANACG